MKLAIASLSLLWLAACNPPPSPAPSSPPQGQAAPATPAANPPMAKRVPGQQDEEPLKIFRAFGTEPFWNVNVEGSRLTYTTPQDQAGQVMQGQRRAVEGGVELTGSHEGQAFTLTVSAGDCSDGMSDTRYRLVATFRLGDAELKGCGEQAM